MAAVPLVAASLGIRSLASAAWLVLLACSLAAPAGAQGAGAEEPEFPGAVEVTVRYRALAEAAAAAEQEVARLERVSPLETDLLGARQRLDEVQALVAAVTEAEYMRLERIGRIADQVAREIARIETVRDEAIERLTRLDHLRFEWAEQRRFWQGWQAALRAEDRLQVVQPQFERALSRIGQVVGRAEAALPEVLRVQEDAASLRVGAEHLAAQVEALREGRREALLQRDEPLLFSREHLAELGLATWRAWRPGAALQPDAYAQFARANLGLMLLHGLLIVALFLGVRGLRWRSLPAGAWNGLLRRPTALAVFAATALLSPHYALAPPLWDVLVWTLLAASGAVLATGLLRRAPLRFMVYFFAGSYPLLLLFEALLTPPPIFRLALALAALAGVLAFGFLVRREFRRADRDAGTLLALEVGAVLYLAVLLAEVFGFYLLARWILHATVTSAYVVFVVVFVLVLARGAIETLVRFEARGRLSFLRDVGVPFIRQVLRLLQAVLVIVALLQLLHIWELAPTPGESWQRLTDLGFTFAGIEITIGRVVAAAILLYLAIGFSWLLRAFARSEVYPRWELERGVGESINRLVHYFLITIGFFVALGALGVELQSFAIVLGALGVGIGFGLQNIVNNFISGLILLFERPVRVGDTIIVEGELGIIQKIGLRSTTVLTFDQAEVIVPNGDLISEKVTNWTLTDPVARLIVPVGVAYGSDVEKVLAILREVAASRAEVIPEPQPQVLFTGFGDSSLNFELRVWVQELGLRLEVRSDLLAEIDRRFREEAIEIPFPQRDLHVRSVDARVFEAARNDPDATGNAER